MVSRNIKQKNKIKTITVVENRSLQLHIHILQIFLIYSLWNRNQFAHGLLTKYHNETDLQET